jgi:hypothetical protein
MYLLHVPPSCFFLLLARPFCCILQGGDLMTVLMKHDILTDAQTRFYIGETAMAIASVHRLNYVHRCVFVCLRVCVCVCVCVCICMHDDYVGVCGFKTFVCVFLVCV